MYNTTKRLEDTPEEDTRGNKIKRQILLKQTILYD